jgi:hypothetical protein
MKLRIRVGKRMEGSYQRLTAEIEQDNTASTTTTGNVSVARKKEEIMDSGLLVTVPKVWVSTRMMAILSAIQDKAERNEFSCLMKGEWTKDGFTIGEDYVIPKQEVGGCSVDYAEPLSKYMGKYNVVLHSHPFSQTSNFSGSLDSAYGDEGTININFTCSLLYGGARKIEHAILNVEVAEGTLLHLSVEIGTYQPHEEVEVKGLGNIVEKSSTYRRTDYSKSNLPDYGTGFGYMGFSSPKDYEEYKKAMKNGNMQDYL